MDYRTPNIYILICAVASPLHELCHRPTRHNLVMLCHLPGEAVL